ncbi:hypothetical protein AM501_11885 [Aneurinibacillus migulanus]|uniref:Membrane protein n=1 Tax=Aneurinibacillus migulanus TaxID=47500 RepID=A0A0D1W7S1_ANEMI|nr:AI-2E family transporter [Aneurinibacillus migulanus]KIV51745.1 membrane protein [Aneurinibacillus migulanus]KIV54555.1 membrane protein [Aneurinibacillus migulanus]KON97861.1 membrane protein [Aneurinibacillus migulanus]KPD08049.1 hypothetical protein AM501_11885 [Aneurinibacillus migulanus]MCP1354004.1 AI-2E family transporter [Aneurinibacillus migulanus]
MEIKNLFREQGIRRVVILLFLCLVLYSMKSMLNIILLTFLITFLMNSLYNYATQKLNKLFPVNQKVVLLFLYIILILILVIGIYKALPTIVHQITQLTNLTKSVYNEQQDHELVQYVVSLLGDVNIEGYVKQSLDFVLKISNWGLNMLLALILSLFFLLEKTKVTQFTAKFKTSKLAWFFNEIEFFGKKFVHTFGKVIEAQFLIALTNCVLSTIMLWIMGFPQLFGLALMIFVLGLIPVAGVIISLIPLCTIAFSIGGFIKVIYVLVMVVVLHSLEAYLLNPKLMASKTNLPMFYTFIVLIFSEHFFGVWGLIVGIPTFVFLLDILDVKRT